MGEARSEAAVSAELERAQKALDHLLDLVIFRIAKPDRSWSTSCDAMFKRIDRLTAERSAISQSKPRCPS